MRRFLLPCLLLLAGLLCACGDNGERAARRAERGLPAVSVSSQVVQLRRSPGPPVLVEPDGGLRVDDVLLPQPPQKQRLLSDWFEQLQRRRMQALPQLQDGGRTVAIKPDAELQALQARLLERIPELRPYADSLGNIRLEPR
ncbi:MAG: hypothetical protein QM601_04525 [Pseudoxanthomonas sp.]